MNTNEIEESYYNQVGGKTPLHVAAKMNSIEIFMMLVKKGADINAKDIYKFILFMII